jgi:hypothetical protein
VGAFDAGVPFFGISVFPVGEEGGSVVFIVDVVLDEGGSGNFVEVVMGAGGEEEGGCDEEKELLHFFGSDFVRSGQWTVRFSRATHVLFSHPIGSNDWEFSGQ